MDPDIIMLWVEAVMCFIGFFRAGEITIPTLPAFNSSNHLSRGDLAIDNKDHPQVLKVRLKKLKVDHLGKGVDVYMGKTDCHLCPVIAFIQYMSARGSAEVPFFIFKNENYKSTCMFKSRIRAALKSLGLPEENFTGHSFRIGAATTAASVGIEHSVIHSMGRWSSSASLVYIHAMRMTANFLKDLSPIPTK